MLRGNSVLSFFVSWEQRKLKDESDYIVAGGDIEKNKIDENGKYPVIANALTNEGIVGYYKEDYRIKAPAVTVTGRGDVGHAVARNIDFTPVVRLLTIKSKHYNYFLENAINNLNVVVESTGVPQLTVPQLENYEIQFPKDLNEETQIGNLFKQIDNLITLHQSKYDKLVNVKKALLEKMFPKDGKNVPEIRFKGFTDTWEQRKLEGIYKFQYGEFNNNPSNGGIYPVYGANGIIGGYTNYNAENSVIIGHMGEYAGSVLWGNGKHFVTYNGTISKPRGENVVSKFGYYMLYQKDINKICGGSGLPFLSYEQLNKIEVCYPKDIKEQKSIANYLTNIDNLITLHQHK